MPAIRDHQGRLHHRFGDYKADRAEEQALRQRIADLRLGASGMSYFGDWAEAEALLAEADRLERGQS